MKVKIMRGQLSSAAQIAAAAERRTATLLLLLVLLERLVLLLYTCVASLKQVAALATGNPFGLFGQSVAAATCCEQNRAEEENENAIASRRV